jgi:hypothetical protein
MSITIGERLVDSILHRREPESQVSNNGVLVRYEADADGIVRQGLEITQPRYMMDCARYLQEDRKILLEDTDDRQYYIRGNYLYDMTLSKREGRLIGRAAGTKGFPMVMIGLEWLSGDDITAPIKKIEIRLGTARDDGSNLAGEERGADPFRAADELLDQLAREQVTREQEAAAEGSPRGFRERIQRKMAQAAEKLRGQSALIDIKMTQNGIEAVGSRLRGLKEYYSDERLSRRRRMITGAVIGGLALYAVT